jgi:hypothetical protein
MTTYDFDLADLAQSTFSTTVDQAVAAAQAPALPSAPVAVSTDPSNSFIDWLQGLGTVPKLAIGAGVIAFACGVGCALGGGRA